MKQKKTPSKVEIEAYQYWVALDYFPEFAARVGVLISCFAILESYVHLLISKLTGIGKEDAFTFSGSFGSFTARVDLIETLVKRRGPDADHVATVRHFVGRLREAIGTRNRYAHATYSLGSKKGEKVIQINMFQYDVRGGKKPKTIVQDLDQVSAEVRRMKFIVCELHAYLFRDELPETEAPA